MDKYRRTVHLGGILAAEGMQLLRSGDQAAALTDFLDAVRLALLIRGDGDDSGSPNAIARKGLSCIRTAAPGLSAASLERASAEIRRLHSQVKPPTANIAYALRGVDHGSMITPLRDESNALNKTVFAALESVQDRRLRAWARSRRDEILALSERPYPEAKKWADRARAERGWWSAYVLASDIDRMVAGKASADVEFYGSDIAIALERYRRSHGSYPETLDALAPDYFDSVPSDPFTLGPFIYKRSGDDYQLYSAGRDGRDEGGGFIPEGRSKPIGDDKVVHWPRGG